MVNAYTIVHKKATDKKIKEEHNQEDKKYNRKDEKRQKLIDKVGNVLQWTQMSKKPRATPLLDEENWCKF